MTVNDGGPAFPCWEYDAKGMSLRDWFAGMALRSMLASDAHRAMRRDYAAWAFEYADAMIEQRKKETP